MSRETDYVNYLYAKYHGRVAIGVGYNPDLSEIFPFVFQNKKGESIGIVAVGLMPEGSKGVYIYHLGAFISRRGNGSIILKELCRQADKFNISLSLSAISSPNGDATAMNTKQLARWYKSFGFKGESGLSRSPKNTHK